MGAGGLAAFVHGAAGIAPAVMRSALTDRG